MTGKIKDEFNRIAGEYDAGRRKFIPCFDRFYDGTTESAVGTVRVKPGRILDLGAGTGLLTAYWMRHFQDAEFLLSDVAGEMLDVARQRFSGCGNVSFLEHDYTKGLPSGKFDAVISALSIHHLENPEKKVLFGRIRESLTAGGIFANYDQFNAGTPEQEKAYESDWMRFLESSGLTDDNLRKWRVRRELDCECTVPEELAMLEECGFCNASCIFNDMKFAVVTAVV